MASLGNDLAQIRKEQDLSLDDINEATKIPKRILRSIEDDSIFTDFEENATYVRSYVRGYAKALSIDERQIIYALDKQEKNDYSGSLLTSGEQSKRMFEYDSDDDSPSGPDEDMIHDHSPEFRQDENTETDNQESDNTTGDSSSSVSTQPTSSKRSEVSSVDWADMGRQFQPLKTTRSKTWIGLAVIILVVAGGAFFYFFQTDRTQPSNDQPSTSSQESANMVSTDSLELNIVPSTEDTASVAESSQDSSLLRTETFESLPDTLNILLYAAYDKLEPVRVYTDIMENINPYWIEQGEALRFNFVNEIRIRGDFSRIALIMNGHVIENFREQFYNPDTRLVEIPRSFFEDDPKWLEPNQDSLAIDAPPPSVIRERPTFN
jgi:hypothetical protein